jgi:cysteine-rich repeat protein
MLHGTSLLNRALRIGKPLAVVVAVALASASTEAKTITQIIDATGDGAGNPFETDAGPAGIAVDGLGNVYVTGYWSQNAFRIDPNGMITQIIDATGDGEGNTLTRPTDVAVDESGNVYVAGGLGHNAFRIDPSGGITEIIDATGDGAGNPLGITAEVAMGGSGNVYVTGFFSTNAFRIEPNGVITEIIDITGDGEGNTLLGIASVAVGGLGNVYVTGAITDNAFRIDPSGVITEIIDETGDGAGNALLAPWGVAVDGLGNVYVTGNESDNVFRIDPSGVITEIIDGSGDGAGKPLDSPAAIAVDGPGNVYVAGAGSNNAFRIDPNGVITEIVDATGDGAGNPLDGPAGIAVDGLGNVYVTGGNSDNAFRIDACGNGISNAGEECDDGNNVDGDGCSARCLKEFCGDGVRQAGLGEQCDDGNNNGGDGCSATCEVEPQPQDEDQQRCINTLNEDLWKVSNVQAREILSCIEDGAQGTLAGLTIEECLTADRRLKLKAARLWTKGHALRSCRFPAPDFGATDATTLNAVAMQKEIELIHRVFGSDLDAAIFSASGDTQDASLCQRHVAESVRRCQDERLRGFNRCKEKGLEDGNIQSFLDLQLCLDGEPTRKIAKACDPATGRIRKYISRKCVNKGIDLSDAFLGCGTDDAADLAACLHQIVECEVCLALNEADALSHDCDELDDGAVNGSCP